MKNPALFALLLATSTLGVHAQSTTAANPYDVPMFAGQVGEIVVGSETGFASTDWTPSTDWSEPGALDSVASGPSAQNFAVRSLLTALDIAYNMHSQIAEDSGNMIYPVTRPTLFFSDSHSAVQISGAVTNDGKPVPGATVNVEVDLDGGFVNINTINADNRGFYTIRVPAPAKITAVQVTAPSFCSVRNGCDHLYNSLVGEGAIAQ